MPPEHTQKKTSKKLKQNQATGVQGEVLVTITTNDIRNETKTAHSVGSVRGKCVVVVVCSSLSRSRNHHFLLLVFYVRFRYFFFVLSFSLQTAERSKTP